jgi:hypothetical protein
MSSCSTCKDLDKSLSLDHGTPLIYIRKSYATGCQTCGVLLRSVLTLKDDGIQDTNLMIGWDTTRIDGLRIVVGSIEPRGFLFGIDMFVRDGKKRGFSSV